MRRTLLYTLSFALLAIALAGCSQSKQRTWDDPGPEATFRQYLMHWFHGEREQAFAMIAPDDRKRLTRPLEGLDGELEGESLPESHEMLIAGRIDNPYDIKSMEASPDLESRPESGTRVMLELDYHDHRTGEARVVWQDEHWYVDLPLDADSTSASEE